MGCSSSKLCRASVSITADSPTQPPPTQPPPIIAPHIITEETITPSSSDISSAPSIFPNAGSTMLMDSSGDKNTIDTASIVSTQVMPINEPPPPGDNFHGATEETTASNCTISSEDATKEHCLSSDAISSIVDATNDSSNDKHHAIIDTSSPDSDVGIVTGPSPQSVDHQVTDRKETNIIHVVTSDESFIEHNAAEITTAQPAAIVSPTATPRCGDNVVSAGESSGSYNDDIRFSISTSDEGNDHFSAAAESSSPSVSFTVLINDNKSVNSTNDDASNSSNEEMLTMKSSTKVKAVMPETIHIPPLDLSGLVTPHSEHLDAYLKEPSLLDLIIGARDAGDATVHPEGYKQSNTSWDSESSSSSLEPTIIKGDNYSNVNNNNGKKSHQKMQLPQQSVGLIFGHENEQDMASSDAELIGQNASEMIIGEDNEVHGQNEQHWESLDNPAQSPVVVTNSELFLSSSTHSLAASVRLLFDQSMQVLMPVVAAYVGIMIGTAGECKFMSKHRYVPLLCASLTFALHAITISNGSFVYDDRAAVLSNPDVLGQRGLFELFRHDFWGQDITLETSHKSFRPVATLSLRLSHMLYGGPDARGFHFDNVLLHALVVYCFSMFCFHLFSNEQGKAGRVAPILASIMYSAHPIHVESVASITGRSDILAGLLFIAAILLYRMRNTKPSSVALATLAGVLSTFSKEVGVTSFGIFVASDAIELLSSTRQMLTKSKLGIFASQAARNIGCAILLTCFHLSLHGDAKMYKWTILENSISTAASRTERVLSYAHVATVYLWKMIYPFNLSYDYGWPCIQHVTSVYDIRNAFTLAAIIAVVFLGWYSLTRRNAILTWSLALATIPFVPASNLFFPVGTILAERLLYIPSMGFCLGAGYGIAQLLNGNTANSLSKQARGVSFILMCVYIAWFGLKTIVRAAEWSTEAQLFESAMKVCPNSLKVLNNHARVLLKSDPRNAVHYLDEAIALHKDYPAAHFNKGLAHESLGEMEEAIQSFSKTLSLNPIDGRVRPLLAGALLSHAKALGNHSDTKEYLLRAMDHVNDSIDNIDAKNPKALYLRCEIGNALEYDATENLQYCEAALAANREKIIGTIAEDVVLNTMGIIANSIGRSSDALRYFDEGYQMNKKSFDILVNLASLHSDLKNFELANTFFGQAESLDIVDPVKALLLGNRGWAFERQGNIASACEMYTRAIGLSQPNPHPQIVTNARNSCV